uniref:Uncharacterized protein n=1 Tax=Zooxanthella nutricula TaxID=1333877 RepID=A0A7S2N9W0_9DINO
MNGATNKGSVTSSPRRSSASPARQASRLSRRGGSSASSSCDDAASAGSDMDLDLDLLCFVSKDMPAADAVRRCIALIPKLQDQAARKAQAKRAEAAARILAEAERELEAQVQAQAEREDSGLKGDVERKLRQIGSLPADADPDLAATLSAQKAEARTLVLQVLEAEKELGVKRLALEYVEGRLPDGADPEALTAAISAAQALRSSMQAQKHAEALRALEEDVRFTNAPTDEELDEAVQEQTRLTLEVQRASEQVGRMQDQLARLMAQTPTTPEEEEEEASPPRGQAPANRSAGPTRRAAVHDHDLAIGFRNTRLPMPLDDVEQALPGLVRESHELEAAIASEDARLAASDAVLRDARQTLETLEESKILFLEQIARERPALIDELLAAEGRANDEEDDGLESSSGSSSPSERGADAEDPFMALSAEERWLMIELGDGSDEEDDSGRSSWRHKEPDPAPAAGHEGRSVADQLAQDMRRLARRLRAEAAEVLGEAPLEAPPKAPPEAQEEDEEASDFGSDPEDLGLPPEVAAEQLRRIPHQDLRALVELQSQNASLVSKVEAACARIDELRAKRGATHDLLVPTGASGAAQGDTAPPEELAEGVRRKARELQALRRRWWALRQDPSTTVRRALAVTGMPEVDSVADEPPPSVQVTMFERIWESMTAP